MPIRCAVGESIQHPAFLGRRTAAAVKPCWKSIDAAVSRLRALLLDLYQRPEHRRHQGAPAPALPATPPARAHCRWSPTSHLTQHRARTSQPCSRCTANVVRSLVEVRWASVSRCGGPQGERPPRPTGSLPAAPATRSSSGRCCRRTKWPRRRRRRTRPPRVGHGRGSRASCWPAPPLMAPLGTCACVFMACVARMSPEIATFHLPYMEGVMSVWSDRYASDLRYMQGCAGVKE